MTVWEKAKKTTDVLATILVVVAAAFVVWTQIEQRWLKPDQPAVVQDVKELVIPPARIRHMRGTGALALVEFTDYECPFCGRHARETAPQIDVKLVERGAIRHVVVHYPLTKMHPYAEKASEAAECGGRQGRFWEMHARLFDNQQALATDDLVRTADALTLDHDQFVRCLEGASTADVRADMAEGSRLGVKATPTFFLGALERDGSIRLLKQITGAVPYQQFASLIETIQPSKLAHQ
jgi:protein-disulfide isomerase